MSDYLIDLKGISKSFGDNKVLDNFSLYVNKNEFVTLLGSSGCGKTTILRLIAGFEKPDAGQIILRGQDITHTPPNLRPCNTVFQRYSLFTHMNIFENIAFGLKINKVPKDEIVERVNDVLHLVNLDGYGKRSCDSLSGGQMQRIAMARALVNRPEVLLLDEPLAALDLKMRQDMQIELKNMQRQLGLTFVYVTHDQEEALAMSDTVVVMAEGKKLQVGTPEDIYNEPKCAYVADFIGESNIIDGKMIKDELAYFAGREFPCVDKGFELNQAVDIVVRPEDIVMTSPEAGMLSGVVESAVFYGMHYEMKIKATDGSSWYIQNIVMAPVGSHIGMNIEPWAIHIMEKGGPAVK